MYLFDRIEEQCMDGTFCAFAVNEQDNQAYLLVNASVETSESSLEGCCLSIICPPEKYVYRGKLSTAIEMKGFEEKLLRLLNEVDKKNNAIPRT